MTIFDQSVYEADEALRAQAEAKRFPLVWRWKTVRDPHHAETRAKTRHAERVSAGQGVLL